MSHHLQVYRWEDEKFPWHRRVMIRPEFRVDLTIALAQWEDVHEQAHLDADREGLRRHDPVLDALGQEGAQGRAPGGVV